MEQINNEHNEHKDGMTCPACGCGKTCSCGKSGWDCGCGYGHMHIHRHFVLRLVLALIAACLVFYVGVKVGEFKDALSSGRLGGGYYRHAGYMMYGSGVVSGGTSGTSVVRPPSSGSTVTPVTP